MRTRSVTSLRQWLAAALLLAVVLVQTLGVMHRQVHGGVGGVSAAVAASTVVSDGAEPGLSLLFSGHASPADCLMLDGLCGGAAGPCAVLPALTLAPAATLFVFLEGLVQARRAALAEPRGPPFFH